AHYIKDRRMMRRFVRVNEISFHHDGLLLINGLFHEQRMEPAQVVMRDHRKEMVGKVVIVADRKYGHADEPAHKEYARVGEALLIGVAVLHDLAKHHEKRERR